DLSEELAADPECRLAPGGLLGRPWQGETNSAQPVDRPERVAHVETAPACRTASGSALATVDSLTACERRAGRSRPRQCNQHARSPHEPRAHLAQRDGRERPPPE